MHICVSGSKMAQDVGMVYVKVLWCHSHLGSIPTCTCFPSENLGSIPTCTWKSDERLLGFKKIVSKSGYIHSMSYVYMCHS